MSKNEYWVSEIFYSLQGEGGRAGEPSIFIRFRGCNMACDIAPGPKSPGGFACDTEFASGRMLTLAEIHNEVAKYNCQWLVLTGGEPGLQVDDQFIWHFHQYGYKIAIESNGSIELPKNLDWITISPKVAEHAIKQLTATEVKYVRAQGQGIPVPAVTAELKYISPAFSGHGLDRDTLDWCIKLCLENPEWRLSVQNHKTWQVR